MHFKNLDLKIGRRVLGCLRIRDIEKCNRTLQSDHHDFALSSDLNEVVMFSPTLAAIYHGVSSQQIPENRSEQMSPIRHGIVPQTTVLQSRQWVTLDDP
jgi:hypothetical protein